MRSPTVAIGAAATLFSTGQLPFGRSHRLGSWTDKTAAFGQVGPGAYTDDLGRDFVSFTNDVGIVWGFAIPEATEAPFDAILQVTSPIAIGWAGLSWGGQMTYSPLAIAWANGESVQLASRMAL